MLAMKSLIIILLILMSLQSFGQSNVTDSVAVRVYNKGKFYIKKYTITIGGKKYTFSDIWKHKYSPYQKLPYLWPQNQIEVTTVRKRFMQYDEWNSLIMMPIDQIGEKIATGQITIIVSSKRKAKSLVIESVLADPKTE